jgi:thiol-disulfide isomerase/thioredoxin
MILLVMPGAGSAAEGEAGAPDRTQLGEFVPATQPVPAPGVSFSDSAGDTVSLSDFRGKLVLVNLWATWCEPCLREMPSLDRLQSRLGDRIAVLAVSEDRGGSKAVKPFIAKLGLKSIKTYLDPKSAVGRAFEVRGLPTTLLIGRDGKVLGRVEGGAEWDSPKMLGVLEPLLAGNGVIPASSRFQRFLQRRLPRQAKLRFAESRARP